MMLFLLNGLPTEEVTEFRTIVLPFFYIAIHLFIKMFLFTNMHITQLDKNANEQCDIVSYVCGCCA